MNIRTFMALSMVMALCAPTGASADDPDFIAGYRTNDFFRFWPEKDEAPAGYKLKSKNSNPSTHMTTADYAAEDTNSMANVRIFGWPLDAPQPVADTDSDIIQESVNGIRKNISDEGWPTPEEFTITPASARSLSCLRTQQSEQAEFVYCVTAVKGRIMEIQHFASIKAKDADARKQTMTGFVEALSDHMAQVDQP